MKFSFAPRARINGKYLQGSQHHIAIFLDAGGDIVRQVFWPCDKSCNQFRCDLFSFFFLLLEKKKFWLELKKCSCVLCDSSSGNVIRDGPLFFLRGLRVGGGGSWGVGQYTKETWAIYPETAEKNCLRGAIKNWASAFYSPGPVLLYKKFLHKFLPTKTKSYTTWRWENGFMPKNYIITPIKLLSKNCHP